MFITIDEELAGYVTKHESQNLPVLVTYWSQQRHYLDLRCVHCQNLSQIQGSEVEKLGGPAVLPLLLGCHTSSWLVGPNHLAQDKKKICQFFQQKCSGTSNLYAQTVLCENILQFNLPAGVISKSPGRIDGWCATWVASMPTESCNVAMLFNIGLSSKLISKVRSSLVAAWNQTIYCKTSKI